MSRNPLAGSLERPTGFEPATSSLGSWHSATELRPPGVLHITTARGSSAAFLDVHVVRLDEPVAPRLPVQLAARPVEVDLLVEGGGRLILDPELIDPMELLEPLLLVHDRLRFIDHPVEVDVVVVRQRV